MADVLIRSGEAHRLGEKFMGQRRQRQREACRSHGEPGVASAPAAGKGQGRIFPQDLPREHGLANILILEFEPPEL